VSGAEAGKMVAQLMISRNIMHGHGAATVRVNFSKKTQGVTRYKYNIVCLSIMVQAVLEFVRQVLLYLPRLTGASS
jgi:hypothetical protein